MQKQTSQKKDSKAQQPAKKSQSKDAKELAKDKAKGGKIKAHLNEDNGQNDPFKDLSMYQDHEQMDNSQNQSMRPLMEEMSNDAPIKFGKNFGRRQSLQKLNGEFTQTSSKNQKSAIERAKSGKQVEKNNQNELNGSNNQQNEASDNFGERRHLTQGNKQISKFMDGLDEDMMDDMKQIQKEVDFHHQIAYRFEKSARLRENKKPEHVVKASNQEIINLIENQIWIIEIDHMIIFYCLYFCAYYRNTEILAFIKELIDRLGLTNKNKEIKQMKGTEGFKSQIGHGLDRQGQIQKIDELLDRINLHGIEKLSDNNNTMCQEFFHKVFYQAVEDNLRLVYDQIMGKLKELNLRDKDALHFIRQRDFLIIKKSFSKSARGMFTGLFMHKMMNDHISKKYKFYNRAYYQELIIKNVVEPRTQFLFRQKFLRTKEDIDSVLEMYCQIDDLEQFAKFDKQIQLSQKRVESLLLVCLRYDSMKIAFHLNQNFGIKFNQTVITALNNSVKDSQWYFEMKLFFLRQSFYYLNVAQMDELLSLFTMIFGVSNPMMHPLVNCYNPVKCSMLVYEICWKIQQKNIYSLQRKCDYLMNYLKQSLDKYFNAQGNISHLYKLMSEPILHASEQKDSMDLMLQMNMDDIIQHKVVEEVLNLVYDGKYSIDASPLYLSSLWNTIEQMPTFSPKSVFKKLISNINTMGAWRMKKQSSVQFHIWKQCIRQRETDEMIFMCLVSLTIIVIASIIDQLISDQFATQQEIFQDVIYGNPEVLENATKEQLVEYCEQDRVRATSLQTLIYYFKDIKIFCAISYISSIMAQMLTSLSKQNVLFDLSVVFFESSMIFSGFSISQIVSVQLDDSLSLNCSRFVNLTEQEKTSMDLVYTLQGPSKQILTFQLILSIIVSQHCLNLLSMLRRTDFVGPSIIMMVALRFDLIKFVTAFSLPIVAVLMIGVFNSKDFTKDNLDAWNLFIQLFSAFTGEQDFSSFMKYGGQTYLVIFILIYFVLLLNLLIAMFSNTYHAIYVNKNAIRLKRILDMKNHQSYDSIIGSVTSTFFPINVVMIPLMWPVIIVKNKKLNEMINKLQYGFMIFLQSFAITILQVCLSPIMYVKMVLNSFNIMIISKNQDGIERYMEPFFSIIASPIIIVLSIIVDLVSLPQILLLSDDEFEEKYQRSVDELNDDQLMRVNAIFQKVLFKDWNKYQGQFATYLELMSMHRSRFGIMENLNDLLCKGSKDYKESLATVQDFNSTKIMTRICSVPAKNGDITQNRIYFDMLKIINLDIQIFNHTFDIFNGGKGLHATFEEGGNLMMGTPAMRKRQRMAEGKLDEIAAIDDEEENIIDQFIRDPYDVMSFYQTNMLCESFTDVNKFYFTDSELLVESKVSQLYSEMQDLLMKEECDTVERLNDVILKQTTNYRAQRIMIDEEPVPIQFFMNGILNIDKDGDGQDDEVNEKPLEDQLRLEYVRENFGEIDQGPPKPAAQ